MVICQWQADQLFAETDGRGRQIIELRDTDILRYFAIIQFNNCFIIRSPSLFFILFSGSGKRTLPCGSIGRNQLISFSVN